MAKHTPIILDENQSQPPRGTVRQGVMGNTKVSTSGGPKPSVESLDAHTHGPRDNQARNK